LFILFYFIVVQPLSITRRPDDHSPLSGLRPQVRILRLLRILGRKNEGASDAMNDLLAQVQRSLSGRVTMDV